MSDFIETNGDQAAFASLREPGWHQLGTVFTKPVTVQELLDLAHLSDWNVRVVEIEAPGYNFGSRKYYFVVRDNPFIKGQEDVLHVSKARYTRSRTRPCSPWPMVLVGGRLLVLSKRVVWYSGRCPSTARSC